MTNCLVKLLYTNELLQNALGVANFTKPKHIAKNNDPINISVHFLPTQSRISDTLSSIFLY